MNADYLLEQLLKVTRAARKAQKDYYKCPGNPRADPMKSSYLAESKRREQDLDRLLKELEAIHPVTA
jgi:hypothetical protein